MTNPVDPTTTSTVTPQIGLNASIDAVNLLLEVGGTTVGFDDGTEVNVLIMDIMGNSTSVLATIQNGSFLIANIDASKFTPGQLTVTATANDTLAQATEILPEIVAGDPIVITEQPVLNGQNKLTVQGKAPSLKPNDELTLVVRDSTNTSVTATALVQADGSFSVTGLSTQGLKDGLLSIDVMALTDSGSISVVNAASVTMTNLTPLGSDKALQATEDIGLAITAADFGYSNTDGFSMTGVKIAGLPAQGTLKLNGVAVVEDQFVSMAQLSAGQLVFQAATNANGSNYANFKFKVLDSRPVNNEDLVANTITLNVAAVNDAPVVTTAGAITTVNEDSASATATTLWSTAPAFGQGGGSDENSQTLTYKITAIPAFITLFKADGTTAVTAGTTVTATEFTGLKYKTVANANGTGSVTFDVIDSGSGTAPNANTLSSQSVSMTVNAVNDVPVVTTAGAITTVNEDSASATAATLWSTAPVFTAGPSDESSQTLTYKITAIPAFITLFKADGTTAVTAGTTVTATEFAALKYKTVADANGTGNVTFDVIDSGSSTAPNANTLSSQSVSMTVNAVNDVPVVTTAGAITTVNEDSASATATSLWSTAPAFSQGPSDENSQTLTYKITAIPAFITLFKADGTTAVTAGTTVTATEFTGLKYKTVADANGTGNVTFDVIDSGSSTAPNANTLSSQSVSMTVNAVNDAPVLANTVLDLTAVIQGSATPVGAVGVLVSSLVGGVSDVDAGAEKGIAITGFNSGKGQLFFSTNGGTNWTEITSASEANARLLKSDTDNRVYFKAAAGTQGTVADALTFRAWDATTGTEGQTGDAAANGGTTAFSTATDTVSDYVVAPVTINVVSTDDLVAKGEAIPLTGKADPNATVKLNINGALRDVTADATGNWSYNANPVAAVPQVRYIMVRKNLLNANGWDINGYFGLSELSAMQGTTNLAAGKTVTTNLGGVSSTTTTLTDGSLAGGVSAAGAGQQWVQIDLGASYAVDSIQAGAVQGTNGYGYSNSMGLNNSTIYTSLTSMAGMTTAQLDAATTGATPTVSSKWVSDAPHNGSSSYNQDLFLEGANTITASELVQGVSSQASRVVSMDRQAPSSITLIGTDDVGPVTGTIVASSVTNDDKPTFSGITEANAVVKVYDGATLLGTTTASGTGAWSFTPTTAMATGAHSVTATATDAAGNTSPATTALPFTIDTTAPVAVADTNSGTEDAATVTGTVATNDTSKDGSETFALVGSGTGTKGTVVINANGSYTYTRTSSADEITANLVETFTYSVTDAAGNTSQSTLKITLTPVNDAATFTGDINKTITETNAAQSVGGTLTVADVDSATTVVAQTAANGSAGYGKFTISSAGVWSYLMNTAQNQFVAGQTYDDKLTVTTADGTQQEIKVTITGTNDAPVLADTTLNMASVLKGSGVNPVGAVGMLVSDLVGGVTDADTGAVKGIAITGFNSGKGQLFFSTNGGTDWTEITSATEASARLLKSDTDNRVFFKAATGTQGAVADALTFRAWDGTTGTEGLTGNASVNDGTTAFSKDSDSVSQYVVQPVTINAVSTDDLVNVSEPLLITGKADPNAVVTLNINSQNFNVTANATGDWSYDGSKVRYVMVRKSLMNLPNTDPDYNLKGILTIGEVEIYQKTTNTNLSTLPGVTQSYSNVNTFTTGSLRDMNAYYTAGNYVETSGSQMGLAAGVSQDAWVQIDLGAAYSLADIKLVGAQNLNARMNGATIYTSATDMSALTKAQLDSSVLVNKGTPLTGLTNAGWQGYWASSDSPDAIYGNALNEGPNTITASELVQGVSSQATRVVTLDTIAPVTTVTSAALSSDTGTSNTDFITSVAAQTITGNLSANLATGEKVMVSLDNGVTWTAATATVGTSTWSLPGVTLSGTNTLQAKVVDTAGNGSTPYTKVYALVTVSDLTVGITQIDDNAGTPSTVFSNGTTNDTTPQLTGNLGGATQGAALATNEVVNVYRTPNLAAATVLQAGSLPNTQIVSGNPLTHYFIGDGNYGTTGQVYLPTTPGDGHMVVFTKTANWGLEVYAGTTLVGNVGTANVPSGGQDNLYFKWDAAKGQWLTGTNALIKVGTAVVTTAAAGQSTWTLTDNTGLGNSDSVNYIAQVENTAGTFGRQSTPGALDWRYNVDNVAPSSITLIGTDDVAPVAGTITANAVINDDKPTFSGITEANAVVKVYDGATLLGTTTANGTGAWSFTPTTAMATGTHSVTATATDAYGNTSAPTTALPFTIDTTAPVAVADTNSGTEDAATVTGTVATNDTSKDGSETFALVGSGTGTKGTVVINANGSYTYTRTTSANEITANLVETFTYSVTDAAGNTSQSTLKIILTPVNDAATFTGDINKTITETNAAQSVGGTLTVADVDSATTVVAQTDAAGSAGYGKFTISTAGVWSYLMNTAQNQFVAGQTYDDKLTVTTADGTQQEIKVTITGTNDTPTVVSSTSSTGKVFFTENGAPVLARGGTITLADVDSTQLQSATVRVVDMTSGSPVTGDTLTFTIPSGSGITSSFDTVTGTMTFTGSATQAQYQALFDTVKFSNARNDLAGGGRNVYYAVKDSSGVSSTEALTRVDVLRLNDAPVLDNTTNLSLAGIAPTAAETAPVGVVGVLVSSLVGGVTDADLKLVTGVDVPQGIAIVGANSALGKVYFSQNNGTSWFTPSFDIADTAALLLKADANTRVYFRPNAGVEGTIANALTIRAWDTTDNKSSLNGSNVVQHNVSTTLGGTNAYSVAVDTVSLSVATVASAPAFNGTTGVDTQTGTAANEVFLGNGGADVITAGAGNDKVVLNTSNVTALSAVNTANINGGTGINILKLIGTELTLDLTNATVAGKLDGFSTVDMTSNVNNLLKLNLLNVQTFSGATDNAATTGVDESQMMVVLGDTGDAVALQDAATWSVLNGLKGTDLTTLYGADYGFSSTRQYTQYSKSGATLFVDELAPVGDIVGTSGTDTLTGTANADVIYGNGGVDTIAAGAGKDTVILGASSLTALASTANTATVNGGTDINTLKLSGINLNLDLTNTTVMGKLDNFNVVDMKQGSGNKFKLGLTEVLALAGGTDNAATVGVDESKMLVLQGNGGVAYNSLQLVDSVNWTSVTNLGGTSLQATYGASYGFEAGRSYTQYTSATGSANLFVDQTLLHTLL